MNPWDQLVASANAEEPAAPVEQPEPADAGTQQPDELTTKIRAQLEEEVINALVEERTDSPFYKGMQKALSKRDRQLQAAEQARAVSEQTLAALQSEFSSLKDGMGYLSEKMFANLPEEEREAVVRELQQKRIDNIENQNKALMQRLNQPQAPQPTAPTEPDDDIEAMIRRETEEAVNSMRDTVKEFGLDPNDKRLDYGKDDEKFAVRFRKLNASVAAAMKGNEEAEVDSVRPKASITPTRKDSSGRPIEDDGQGHSLLRRGADKLLEEMRAATPARR